MILSVSLAFSMTSCGDTEPVGETPELPPVESMKMDFSDFANEPGGTKGTQDTYQAFWHSYWTVFYCNIWAAAVSALPVTAYGYALQQTPEYVGDNTWEWSYSFNWDSKEYTATLTGARKNNAEFTMEMVIALTAAPNQGVKYFDGLVRYDHTQATWTIYKEGTTSVLEIAWNKDYETGEADLTYTYTEPEKEYTDSYVTAAYMPDEFFDASYTISVPAGMTDIEWNTETIEGRVMAPAHFDDDAWHCWASSVNGLADKACSQ